MNVRKYFHLIVILFLFVTLLLQGNCNQTEAASPEIYEIRLSAHFPAGTSTAILWESWAKDIEEKSGGRVKFTFFYQGTLAGGGQIYQALLKGIADIGFVVNATYQDTFPLNSISEVPQMFPNSEVAAKVMNQLREEFPGMREEFKNVKVLYQVYMIPRMMFHTEKPIRVPSDLAGQNMICEGTIAEYIKGLGGNPVSMTSGDWYMSLERGVADGIVSGYSSLSSNKVLNLIPYHTEMNLSFLSMGLMMNLNTWNRLPSDIQKLIDDSMPGLIKGRLATEVTIDNLEENDPTFKPELARFIELSEEELNLWYDSAKGMQQQWVDEQTAEGRPLAKDIMARAHELVKKYSNTEN